MNHYTYLITFPDNMKYAGVRSTELAPELDTCYLGSGRHLPERDRHSCHKMILGEYDTRDEAVEAETSFIRLNNCVDSNEWFNRRDWNYDKHGQTKETSEGVAKAGHKLTGRTKENYEYIRRANEKRKAYSGANRTPAQIVGHLRTAEAQRGTKNPDKGRKGISNNGFQPWYYIKPCGELIVVNDVPKQDYAESIGLSPRQLGHRFHYTNINKPAKLGACKGWIFGNLEDLSSGTV
jgi:hypothetical protein